MEARTKCGWAWMGLWDSLSDPHDTASSLLPLVFSLRTNSLYLLWIQVEIHASYSEIVFTNKQEPSSPHTHASECGSSHSGTLWHSLDSGCYNKYIRDWWLTNKRPLFLLLRGVQIKVLIIWWGPLPGLQIGVSPWNSHLTENRLQLGPSKGPEISPLISNITKLGIKFQYIWKITQAFILNYHTREKSTNNFNNDKNELLKTIFQTGREFAVTL